MKMVMNTEDIGKMIKNTAKVNFGKFKEKLIQGIGIMENI